MQNVGHCHPKVVRAVQKQAESFIHPCFHVTPYENYITLAEKINEKVPGTSKKKRCLPIVVRKRLKML